MKRENWLALDGLRGASIISVAAVHLWAHASRTGNGLPITLNLADRTFDLTWIFATGHNAVVIFFVLSGFLLYRHWLEKAGATTFHAQRHEFYRRRLFRILPAWIFFLAVYALLVIVAGRHRYGADLTFSNIFANISFLAPLSEIISSQSPWATSLDILPGTWSLNAEMWFYLLMPFLVVVLARLRALGWILLCILPFLAPLARYVMGDHAPFILRFSLIGVLDSFLLGMLVARLSVAGYITPKATWLFPLGAMYYVAICAGLFFHFIDYPFQLALASALMVAGLIASDKPSILTSPKLVYIGKISFSMFLSNILIAWYIILPMSEWLGVFNDAYRFLLNLLIGFPLIVLVSHYSFKWIEQPFIGVSRTPIDWKLMIRSSVSLTLGICALALTLIVAAYTKYGKEVVEFHATPIALLSRPFAQEHAILKPVYIASQHAPLTNIQLPVDSTTKTIALNAEQTSDGTIHIVSAQGITPTETWATVNLPVDLSTIHRHQPLRITAKLVIEHPSATEVCLGIYTAGQDMCSSQMSLSQDADLSISSYVTDGLLQLKINIFPKSDTKPFAFRLENLRIEQ